MSESAVQSEEASHGSLSRFFMFINWFLVHCFSMNPMFSKLSSSELLILIISSHFFLLPELGDTEDHVHHAGGAGDGAGVHERRVAGEGAAVGSVEVHAGGREEPGREKDQRGPETAGLGEAEQVSQLCWLRLSSAAQNISATKLLPTHPQHFWQILQSSSDVFWEI